LEVLGAQARGSEGRGARRRGEPRRKCGGRLLLPHEGAHTLRRWRWVCGVGVRPCSVKLLWPPRPLTWLVQQLPPKRGNSKLGACAKMAWGDASRFKRKAGSARLPEAKRKATEEGCVAHGCLGRGGACGVWCRLLNYLNCVGGPASCMCPCHRELEAGMQGLSPKAVSKRAVRQAQHAATMRCAVVQGVGGCSAPGGMVGHTVVRG